MYLQYVYVNNEITRCITGANFNIVLIFIILCRHVQVQLLEDKGRIERLARSCTQECNPGCSRLQSVKKCETCCTQPLCNVGNDAVTIQPILLTALVCLVVYVVGNLL